MIFRTGLAMIAIIGTIIACYFMNPLPKKVVIDSFVQLENPETGVGVFTGHYVGDTASVIFEDTVCRHGMGDTIVPAKILTQ